jgi:hypothetical protein
MEALVTVEANVVYRRRCDAEGHCVNVEVPADGGATVAPADATVAAVIGDGDASTAGADPVATYEVRRQAVTSAADAGASIAGGDAGVADAPADSKLGQKRVAGKGKKKKKRKKKKSSV